MIGDGLARRNNSIPPNLSRRFVPTGVLSLLILSSLFPFLTAASASELSPPKGMTHFYRALDASKAGKRKTNVVVLHLGDSHIALDHMTGEMRQRWQALFGDGGRGLPPGVPYRYYAPQGYDVTMTSEWTVTSSLRSDAEGPFGISGFRTEATSSDARMELTTSHDIETVEIEAYGGPDSGSFNLTLGNAAPLRLTTRRPTPGVVFLRVPAAKVHEVVLSPTGDGAVTLLGWSMLGSSSHPGLRYDSYGISGATLDVVSHWTPAIVDEEIRRLAPDLILLGYGTNEGFNDHIDVGAYSLRYAAFVKHLQALAPQASIVTLGAFDGARQAKAGDRHLCEKGWATPPSLGRLRDVQREIARRTGHGFIDGSLIMDGPCGISRWVNQEPPLAWPDHVHLRPEGARRAGAAFWDELMQPYMLRHPELTIP